jgi:hypothetical protein
VLASLGYDADVVRLLLDVLRKLNKQPVVGML